MRVLVSGATGFLGKYILDELSKHNYKIVATGRNIEQGKKLENKCIRFIPSDLRDLDSLRALFKDIDIVVHAGALSSVWGNPKDFYDINFIGTKNIIRLCKENNVKRLVYISSPSIYSKAKDQFNIKEVLPKENNLTPYIWSKLLAEKVLSKTEDLDYVILRPRALIGVGDNSIIPRVLNLSKSIGIPLVKGGQNIIDLTCVENVAFAVRLAMESKRAGKKTYNITNGEPMIFKDIIELFLTEMNIKLRYLKLPAFLIACLSAFTEAIHRSFKIYKEPILTRYTYYLLRYSQTLCINKAREDLDYAPIISLREGIEKYAKEYRKH